MTPELVVKQTRPLSAEVAIEEHVHGFVWAYTYWRSSLLKNCLRYHTGRVEAEAPCFYDEKRAKRTEMRTRLWRHVLIGLLFLSVTLNLYSLSVLWTQQKPDPMHTFVVRDRRQRRSLSMDDSFHFNFSLPRAITAIQGVLSIMCSSLYLPQI